jgi:hypothetical protein
MSTFNTMKTAFQKPFIPIVNNSLWKGESFRGGIGDIQSPSRQFERLFNRRRLWLNVKLDLKPSYLLCW